ncbi:MAG: hypothetical protein R3C26_12020 [Calditrichia bacterium]
MAIPARFRHRVIRTVAGSPSATKLTDDAVLSHFFKTTRPFALVSGDTFVKIYRNHKNSDPHREPPGYHCGLHRGAVAIVTFFDADANNFQTMALLYLPFAIQIFHNGIVFFLVPHLSDEIPTDFK